MDADLYQGPALARLAYTPDSNVLDAYWQRTAAILARKPEGSDAELELDADKDADDDKEESAAARALAAAQRDTITGPGRLVALQVCHWMHMQKLILTVMGRRSPGQYRRALASMLAEQPVYKAYT